MDNPNSNPSEKEWNPNISEPTILSGIPPVVEPPAAYTPPPPADYTPPSMAYPPPPPPPAMPTAFQTPPPPPPPQVQPSYQVPPPPYTPAGVGQPEQKKSNKTWIIVAVIAVILLCCCCPTVVGVIWAIANGNSANDVFREFNYSPILPALLAMM